MTCQECELRLGLEQDVAEHVASCASCRALAEEMRANAAAFETFADDPLPTVRHHVMSQVRAQTSARRVARWGWALATAAAILIVMFAVTRAAREKARLPVQISHAESNQNHNREGVETNIEVIASKRPAPRVKRVHKQPTQLTMVKMLTPDPDVVIYWQIESEDGEK